VALIAVLCFRLQLSFPTPTLLCLVVLVVVSLRGSFLSSAVVSIVASGFLDYYFVPPLFSFNVGDPQDIVAVVAFLATSLVITRLVSQVRHLMDERLRLSEAYLSEAQQLSHTGSLGWNLKSGASTWSDETFNILGYDRHTSPSLARVLDRVHPADRSLLQDVMARANVDGSDWALEFRLLLPGNAIRHVHVVARAGRDTAGRLDFIGAMMDVSMRKQAEESLRAAQANLAQVSRLTTVGVLTGSIAHEVNQPLAAVVTNANACLRWLDHAPPNVDEVRDAIRRIVRDGTRGAEVIARMRGLLQKGTTARRPLNVNEVVLETLALADTNLRGVEVRTELARELSPAVVDRVLLQQVLLNLITNALDAMKPATDRPHLLHLRTAADPDAGILVSVRDTGVGVAAQDMERLFETFYTTKAGGLGMGLSICRSIIQSHGGRLWAESGGETGTVFHFTLPPGAGVSA